MAEAQATARVEEEESVSLVPEVAQSAHERFGDPKNFINRELSWLEFNRRVLEEAQDKIVPLLERLKFLAIFSANLDEFFMVRVGGLMQKIHAGITRSSGGDKMLPTEQLERISQTVGELVQEPSSTLRVSPMLGLSTLPLREVRFGEPMFCG